MRSGLSVSFLGIERSAALEARVRDLAERLHRHHERIRQCHISISRVAGRDSRVAVKIHVSVPCAQVHAEGEAERGTDSAGVFSAAGGAFESARRQLSDLQRDARRYSLMEVARRASLKA